MTLVVDFDIAGGLFQCVGLLNYLFEILVFFSLFFIEVCSLFPTGKVFLLNPSHEFNQYISTTDILVLIVVFVFG